MVGNIKKIKLFISYSHDDDPYFKVFIEGLKKVAKNAEFFEWSVWDDRNIYVGTFWDDEIQKNIKDCNIAMLLVSVGFMASKYIKEKEYFEFVKRYKEKGILIIPVVFKPCDFNRWEDLGKLQFFKPKGSNYSKAEIENFTYADLIKFKETDGTLIPNPNIDRYHLDLVKKVEESYIESLIETETKEIIIPKIPLNSNVNKLSDYPKPSTLFTGRKLEIKEFKKVFDSYRIFAIEGLGGTGKTQFAAKCIEEIISDKNRIIWLNGYAQSHFDVFVESAGYGDVLKGEKKTDLALYSGLKDLIEKDERVIFWDNFNDYKDTAFSKFISFAHQYLQKSTIILITKTDPSIEGITSLPIVRLEGLNEDALKYAIKLKASNPRYSSISNSDLEKICIGVVGHPLAIEFSMWLMGYGKTVDDIMLHMPELSGIKKVEEFSKRLFLDIYDHPTTSDEERECFLMCSVFKERIKEEEIKFLYDGKDIFYQLAGLIDKLLLTFKDGFYEMHPLVRSFSYEKLINKINIHKKAADYYISQRIKTINPSLEEKIFYHLSESKEYESIADSIENFGRKLIEQGHLGMLSEFMKILNNSGVSRPIFEIFYGDIAQIKSEWDKAISHFANAKQNSEDKNLIAESSIKFGEILFRRGDISESLPFFEEAYKFSKINCLVKEEARALNDIGLVYYMSSRYDIANDNLKKALKIRKIINDEDGIAATYNNLGLSFDDNKKYEKALEYYNYALKINEELLSKSSISINLLNIGGVLRKQEKYEKALNTLLLALKIGEEIGDVESISRCLNSIGVVYLHQNQPEKALLNFKKGLKLSEEIGGKTEISTSYTNLGSYYFGKELYELSLENFFKSLDIVLQLGLKVAKANVYDWIYVIKNKLGKEKFKELAIDVFNKLDIKKHIQLNEFINKPIIKENPERRRNELCYCGSGKKYKKCHGSNV